MQVERKETRLKFEEMEKLMACVIDNTSRDEKRRGFRELQSSRMGVGVCM